MKINRSNNIPIESVEVNTQNQAEQPRPTTTGIASHRDTFETAQPKENSLFSNFYGGPLIGTAIGNAIGNSTNNKEDGPEKATGSQVPFTQVKANNANDQAQEAAEKQRELLVKENKEITSEQPILAVIAAVTTIAGNVISKAEEDKEAAKEKESSTSDGRPVRRDDDDD